jgi:class 3 adenylate cyclase
VANQPVERKLSAIFAADIAGYSRLMSQDEVGTLARLKTCRAIIDGLIATHRGRIFNTAGDSVIADFASAVDAVACAVAAQNAIATESPSGAGDEPMRFRIGVHVGDVMVDGANLLGDGVNIAARLEALAQPGAICISAVVRDHIGNKLPIAFTDLGDQAVKNIPQPIRAYCVEAMPVAIPGVIAAPPLPDKPSIAVLPFQNISGDPEQEYFADGMVEDLTTALSKNPLVFRHRAQFELHIQGASRRREASRPRAWRTLCARRLSAQRRQSIAHISATGRCHHRQPRLGRTLRPRPRRHLRGAGRDHRAGSLGNRARALRR